MSSISVTRSSMPPLDEYVAEISSLWDSHWLTNMGVKHREFEAQLRSYLDVEGVALYTNGHSALECAIEALQLGADGRYKVITTPFTFASTTHAIARKGLTPVFADIKLNDFTIDPKEIEKLVDDKTCAILPVHVYGNICDVDSISNIAKRHNLKVIYDAAHAFGVRTSGDSVAKFGDISMFSFHATKVFNTIEGGALCYRDCRLSTILNQWKNFGITGPESAEYIGGNAKMNEFCAAMGLCNLRHIQEEIDKRKTVAHCYWRLLESVPGIRACVPPDETEHNYAYLPVVFNGSGTFVRDKVFEALSKRCIGARKYFYPLTSDLECYRGKFDSNKTPNAKYVANHILTLPMYADLSLENVEAICHIVKSAIQEGEN
ncbi:DegT/DnrJ/EryC1/StrS aminotransferase family protein [Paraeggerthella sp. Marseille-Q4926]|uniref:DegT/DnrJ/EryC1/StrS family aminotransferase n=1 Tax=Paraeggerthella sp. Marseille-Q4926 TaxID=2866587 RepID=UPI001CE3BBF7|nr:DegT/DnrJ/EryC1/StrS family aminotransferase [Paraeggerthella sp. Marseille-Q4926]